jgi:transcriptional regulator with XRE-family HTH domain
MASQEPTPQPNVPIHHHLRRERMAAGLSQRALAMALGMWRESYGLMETGKRRIKAEEVRHIASVLGISILRLYGGDVIPSTHADASRAA